MGFSIHYQSTRAVTPTEAKAIQRAADVASEGRTWMHCEPVHFHPVEDDGFLMGSSKPNFLPHPDDVTSAALEGLPDGTCRDMVDVLCVLSRDHGVGWTLGHDHDPDIGSIRGGVCDPGVVDQIEALAELGDILGELDPDEYA